MQNTIAEKENKKFIISLILCAGLGGTLYGYDIGVISGAIVFIKKAIHLSNHQLEIIVGAVLFGCLAGTVATGSLADRFGRRTMILAACIIFALGVGCIVLSTSFITLLLARLLLGVGVGIVAVAVPLYLSEIAPANWRGRSVSAFQIFLTLGILVAYVIDYLFTHSGSWRTMFSFILIPAVVLFISMLVLPETPRWLLSKDKQRQAHKVLSRVCSGDYAEREIKAITASLKTTTSQWRTLLRPEFLPPLLVALGIAISNQLTGINVILQYAPVIMTKAGFQSQTSSMLATVGVGVIQFIFTLIAMSIIDVVGRKRLLIIGTLGLVVVNFLLGLNGWIFAVGQTQAIFATLGLLAYFVFYALGPGVVVWLALSELLPTKVRGKSIALCLFINSLTSAILSSVFLSVIHAIGMSLTYWLFAFCCFGYFLIAYYLLPETKGKTLEQIQAHYQNESVTIESTNI